VPPCLRGKTRRPVSAFPISRFPLFLGRPTPRAIPAACLAAIPVGIDIFVIVKIVKLFENRTVSRTMEKD